MSAPPLGPHSTVCALIPHYESGAWLATAIASLLDQIRPPEAVVVIDDASTEPPVDLVGRYPSVTLLTTSENVGPYRLVQTVIDHTDFDAYLFQDADDVSHPARLATLLDHAAGTGAEMVGSFEVRIDAGTTEATPVEYPTDVNAVLAEDPTAFALLHPTSLVRRDLVRRAGGYPGGLRFGGDLDFLWRAAHVGRVVNVAEYLYLRRVGHESLSGSATTGLRSPARKRLDAALRSVALENAVVAGEGGAPALEPFAAAPPVALRHVTGPEPAAVPGSRHRSTPPRPAANRRAPVVIVGAPRSGTDLLAWALDQHPAFRAVPEGRWLADLVTALGAADESRAARRTGRDLAFDGVQRALRQALRGAEHRVVLAGPEITGAALDLFAADPGVRFVHVSRDPDETIVSLRDAPVAGGDFYAGEAATAACRKLHAIGTVLETFLPPGSLLRLEFDSLMRQPEDAVRRCLEFLGEDPMPACARPVMMGADPSSVGGDGISPPAQTSLLAPAAVASDLRAWRRRGPGAQPLAVRLRAMVARTVPPDAVVSVVSKGDEELVAFETQDGRHFPEAPGGGWAGEYPATSQGAVELLESARQRGTTHLAVPAPALWWLSFYSDLSTHLEERYEVVAFEQGTGIVFRLARPDTENARPVRAAAVHAARRQGQVAS